MVVKKGLMLRWMVLDNRLKEIERLIPQPPKKIKGNNIKFAQKAFTLLKDCGLRLAQ